MLPSKPNGFLSFPPLCPGDAVQATAEPPAEASSPSSSTEDFCYVFMVELERGPSGLGMGLIDGMVRTLDLSPLPRSCRCSVIYSVSIVKASERCPDCLMGLPLGALVEPGAFLWGTLARSRHGSHKFTGRVGSGHKVFNG